MTIGQRIAEQRKRIGLSQEAMGERLEVSRQAVSKWEADGAIPEIDKLIAMSKLFEVSVGWLLGVEEQTAERQESLSEEQLKLIENLVEKYQTPPQPERKQSRVPLVLCVIVSLLAVILAWVAIEKVNTTNNNYDTQFNNLFYSYSDLQNQLGEVSGQLDELVQGEKLLIDYSFSAWAKEDLSGGVISFAGAPRRWQNGDTAYISARYDNREVARAECVWGADGCTAQLELPPKDGYRYYYILNHADGVQEQQHLTGAHHYAIFLAEGLSFYGYAEVVGLYNKGTFTPLHTFTDISFPPLMQEDDSVTWTEATAAIYKNGKEIFRQDLLRGVDENDQPYEGGAYLNSLMFWDPVEIDMEDGDCITAWVTAKTNIGLSVDQQVYSCTRKGDSYEEELTTQLYIE